jgi:hypothetical protein
MFFFFDHRDGGVLYSASLCVCKYPVSLCCSVSSVYAFSFPSIAIEVLYPSLRVVTPQCQSSPVYPARFPLLLPSNDRNAVGRSPVPCIAMYRDVGVFVARFPGSRKVRETFRLRASSEFSEHSNFVGEQQVQ